MSIVAIALGADSKPPFQPLSSFCFFIYGRVSLAMEGKSVMPMDKTFLDNGGYLQ
jgi:hypothetical protein